MGQHRLPPNVFIGHDISGTTNMITVNEAQKIIADHLKIFPVSECPLEESYGAILREDIVADRDQPSFDKVLMDGIAILYASWQRGNRRFKIEGIQAAGQAPLRLKEVHACIEAMTGAVLPEGTDCVIPVEEISVHSHEAVVNKEVQVVRMQNVLPVGVDYKQGTTLLKEGTMLLPPQVAVVASVGKATVRVSYKPKIAIISTGDELVDIGVAAKPYQIRKSNSYALQAALRHNGYFESLIFHIGDDRGQLLSEIGSILKTFDVVILSGGVSAGKFDFIPGVLKELGVAVLFHKVQQKPGKPFWFGMNQEGKAVFALPGNPASTQICFYRYVLPQLNRSMGISKISREFASLAEDFSVKTPLTYFLTVTLEINPDGQLVVTPVAISGSGDYLALANSDGFVELEANKGYFNAKSVVPLYRW